MQKTISFVNCWVAFRNGLCLWYSLDKTVIPPNCVVMTEHMPFNVNSQPSAGQTRLGCHLPHQQQQEKNKEVKSSYSYLLGVFAVDLMPWCHWHFSCVLGSWTEDQFKSIHNLQETLTFIRWCHPSVPFFPMFHQIHIFVNSKIGIMVRYCVQNLKI